MITPLVSIIIPTYNRAQLICFTLDSILNQTYTNWECIVVDDGSNDTTEKLLETYCKKDNRFKYFKRPHNRPKGANACRNFGFELCKGEYINWFDSDDLMFPLKLSLQVEQLINGESEYVFTVCQTLVYDEKTKKNIGLRKERIISNDFFNDFITNDIKWLTQAPLIKKNFLIENKIFFDESLHQSQERDYFVKVLAKVKCYLINEKPMVLFRKHDESISGSPMTAIKNQSNFLVNFKILMDYRNRLTEKSILYLQKSLKSNLKISIKNNHHNLSKQIYKSLNDKRVGLNYVEKSKISLGFLLLKYLRVGEILFK